MINIQLSNLIICLLLNYQTVSIFSVLLPSQFSISLPHFVISPSFFVFFSVDCVSCMNNVVDINTNYRHSFPLIVQKTLLRKNQISMYWSNHKKLLRQQAYSTLTFCLLKLDVIIYRIRKWYCRNRSCLTPK